jgi:hypothetical protein
MVVLREKVIKEINIFLDWKNTDLDWVNYFKIYSDIFLNLLNRKKFKCKWYDIIHVIASEEYNDDIHEKNSPIHKNGSCILSEQKYNNSNEAQKNILALECVYDGIMDLVKRDWWNIDVINSIYKEIQEYWINTELIAKETDSKKYSLKVTYSQCDSELYTIFFILTDKKTWESYKREMNKWNKDFLNMWLASIRISPKNIQMRPGVSTYWDVTEPFDIHIGNFIKGSNFKINYKENK